MQFMTCIRLLYVPQGTYIVYYTARNDAFHVLHLVEISLDHMRSRLVSANICHTDHKYVLIYLKRLTLT